jgi:hypothetical protein
LDEPEQISFSCPVPLFPIVFFSEWLFNAPTTNEAGTKIMSIFNLLAKGKGTVSSSLGKELAARVLDGDNAVLEEALEFCIYDLPNPESKHIRAGAAKTVEIVAEKSPERVASRLESVLPALSAPEPQTRWMILRTCGFCAARNPRLAARAIPAAESAIERKEGLVLASSADLFLGDLGAVSRAYTVRVFPLLEKSALSPINNEPDWILEAFTALSANLDELQRGFVQKFAAQYAGAPRKSTDKRAVKLLELIRKD